MPTDLTINGVRHTVQADPDTPLLWVLRDELLMTGTKYAAASPSAGPAPCISTARPPAPASHRSPASGAAQVTTIEGLGGAHPVQAAWVAHDVPQCGYCQSGQIMSAAALLKKTPKPDDAAIDDAMSGNICRCGTYQRIKAAIKDAAANPTARAVPANAA